MQLNYLFHYLWVNRFGTNVPFYFYWNQRPLLLLLWNQRPLLTSPFIMAEHGSETKAIEIKEIRRQKVYVPKSMTKNQIMEKYGLKPNAANNARKKGFFIKNYSHPQVCVDPSKFNVDLCYNIAGKVFKRNLSRDPVAMSIRDDLIQEAVKSMWEKSGLLKETKKYNINYQYYFVARNYMNSYLTKWKRQMQYNRIIENLVSAVKQGGRRVYNPMFGWVHY